MRLPLQLLLLGWSLTGIAWADDEEDDDDLSFADDDDKSANVDEDVADEDEVDQDEEEDEEDFDSNVPDKVRYQKMNRCYDIVKTSLTKETLDRYVEQLKKDGVSEEMEEDKAKAAIMLDTTFSCYCNVFTDESLWEKARLPLSVHNNEQKQEIFGALFRKDEQLRPKISKKQTAMLQMILMPPKLEKRLTETDEEKAERKQRMKQRAEERAANKGKEKKEKKRQSGGPQMDLPGGLMSMSAKSGAIYVAIVLSAVALILLYGVKKLVGYQAESSEAKQAKKDKKESRKKK